MFSSQWQTDIRSHRLKKGWRPGHSHILNTTLKQNDANGPHIAPRMDHRFVSRYSKEFRSQRTLLTEIRQPPFFFLITCAKPGFGVNILRLQSSNSSTRLGEHVRIFPLRASVHSAWKHSQRAKRNRRNRQKSLTKPSVSCRAWQETLTQLELCAAQTLRSWLTFSLASHQTSRLNAGHFSCASIFLSWRANSTNLVVFTKSKSPISVRVRIRQGITASWMADAAARSRETLEDPASRRPSSAILPVNTSLVFNVNVQLCTDFFLRTSCGSLTMIAEVCPPPTPPPPLSLLKYGNGIIQILEPLFSHSWGGTGTQKDSSAKTRIIFLHFYGDSLGSVNKTNTRFL